MQLKLLEFCDLLGINFTCVYSYPTVGGLEITSNMSENTDQSQAAADCVCTYGAVTYTAGGTGRGAATVGKNT